MGRIQNARITGTVRSLSDFVRDKRREACPICALPENVRADIATARDRHIRTAVVLEWLAKEHGLTIEPQQLTQHGTAKHDKR